MKVITKRSRVLLAPRTASEPEVSIGVELRLLFEPHEETLEHQVEAISAF